VGDLSHLWVLLDVPEAHLAAVQQAQPVAIAVQAFPGRRFQGQVEYVGDLVDERTRTVSVRVAVPNPDGALKPGMFATAEVATAAGDGKGPVERLVVPREAVQKVGEETVVFVPAGDNRFAPRVVQLGATSATEAEVVSGLEPGTSVVTQGAFVLKSELSKESLGGGHSH
jgi:membrane fusion protein, heavy metal efflux system